MGMCPEEVLPEGHGEPHGHHHVGGAAVLWGEDGQEVTTYLREASMQTHTQA